MYLPEAMSPRHFYTPLPSLSKSGRANAVDKRNSERHFLTPSHLVSKTLDNLDVDFVSEIVQP